VPKPVWIEPPVVPPHLPSLDADPLLDYLLASREISREAVAEFFDPSPRPLPDPYDLPGMDGVVERVRRAIDRRETVALYGDYDADGVCSAAIVTKALWAASGGVLPAMTGLPTREAGYGLNRREIDRFHAGGASLLIAVDCASSDVEHVAYAQSLGMDVVVLDHHAMHGPGPAGAIIGSTRADPAGNQTFCHLPAAGLCLLLATALARAGYDVGSGPGREPMDMIDLAMIAVIADVSDLRDPVTRGIVRDGLRLIRTKPRPGLLALARGLDIDPREIDSRTIGMRIAPPLNAAGRQTSADPSLALLLADDQMSGNPHVVSVISSLNWVRETRAQQKIELMNQLLADPGWEARPVLVFEAEGCPHGIAGTLAGDMVKEVSRPVIVLSPDGDTWRGSARSWGDFDVGGAIRAASDLLLRSGGHRMAAGLSIHKDNVAELRATLEGIAREQGFQPGSGNELVIHADLPVERLALSTLKVIDRLRPFGEGNPEPLLRVKGARLRGVYTMGQQQNHLKLQVATPQGNVSAILWGQAERFSEVDGAQYVDIVGHLKKNEYNGTTTAQMICEDFRVSR
jgi:single-stranded-DNA-specific exonuclease